MAETIGLVGVGLLGSAVAERLVGGGFAVVGFDLDEARQEGLRAGGGDTVASAADVAHRCRRIVLSLPDAGVSQAVVAEMEADLHAGATVIDTTTGAPEAMVAIGTSLASRDVAYVDATIGGSSVQARAGDVIVMAGGEAEAVESCADLFQCFARQWFHVGPCGSGARMKLAVNLVLGLHRAVLAEGLSFAKACGLDAALTLEVLEAGASYSKVMDTKGEKMLTGDFAPQARLAQHLKDVRLMLDAGQRAAAKLPLTALHRELLESLVERGLGDADNCAILRAFE